MGVLRIFIARIPPPIGNFLADRLGDVSYRFAGNSRRNAISNMRHVLGPTASKKELKRVVRGVFHNVMRSYYDLCRAPDMSDEDIDRIVDFDEENWKHVLELHEQRRGVILVTSHYGSFDMMTQVLTRKGVPLSALIARIRPEWLSDFITNMRGTRGLDMLVVDEEERDSSNLGALKRCIQILRDGGVIGLVADRNMEAHGVKIQFFGKETLVAPGAAKLALRTRSVLVPCSCYRLPHNRYSLSFEEFIDTANLDQSEDTVKAILTGIFARFEYNIKRHPEQWVLLQPVWKT